MVVNRKNEGDLVFAEIKAACDDSVRFWLNAKALKRRSLWSPGWKTLGEIEQGEDRCEVPRLSLLF